MISVYNLQNQKLSINENKELARGGEGRIILMKSNMVAKIFHQALLIDSLPHFEFLMKMPELLFLAPKDILFQNNQIAGFVMPLLSDDFVPLSALFNQAFCLQHQINAAEKSKIIEQIYQAIQFVHQNNMVIGDLNPYNVMINIKDFSAKMIDVDSYQTPYRKHSGLLLEDIRDYQFAGAVSQHSDFFAFSVLVFNLLSFTHPFKGIHLQFKSLKDRMINAIPVFHEQVKKPKCYIPQNEKLLSVFEEFFVLKKRYLANFALLMEQAVVARQMDILESKDLIIQLIYSSAFRMLDFNDNFAYVKTNNAWLIFESIEKSKIVLRKTIAINDFDQLFLAESTVVAVQGNEWFYDIHAEAKPIKNIQLSAANKIWNYDGILLSVEEGAMFRIFINEIKFDNVRMERVEVFSQGLRLMNSFVQNSGGVQNVFYRNVSSLTTIKLDYPVLSINQKKNYFSFDRKENNVVKHYFARIDGFSTKVLASELDEINSFAVQKGAKANDLIFIPKDDFIEVRSALDFALLTQFAFDGVSSDSALFSTKAGIIVIEKEQIFLVNKK